MHWLSVDIGGCVVDFFTFLQFLALSGNFPAIVKLNKGLLKKKCQLSCAFVFVGLFCCFIQTWCINND